MAIAMNKGISHLAWYTAINILLADRRSLRLIILIPRFEMTERPVDM